MQGEICEGNHQKVRKEAMKGRRWSGFDLVESLGQSQREKGWNRARQWEGKPLGRS